MGILSAAAIFSDDMVLQKGKPIRIWGADYKDRTVTVEIAGKIATSTVKKNKWEVVLSPFNEYGGAYTMTITDGVDTVKYSNITIGEVWLAGGQSNMELELQNCSTGKSELDVIDNEDKDVRFYYTQKIAYMDEYFYAQEKDTKWNCASKENSACWSAVGYYFAKSLAKKLGCTVGVIGCNWGGTSASNWISKERLSIDNDLKSYIDDYDKAMEGKTFEEYVCERDEYFEWEAKWQPKINEYYSKNPNGSWEEAQEYAGGPARYPEPLGPMSSFRYSGLYETMLKRVAPYTLAGFIYYQGESDDHRPQMYAKLFANLIEQWREDFMDEALPFICVQLPMHMWKDDLDRKNWCIIREAQMHISKTIANTGIAVILDCGEYNNIHPVNKVPVGERLSLQAEAIVYGTKSPIDTNGAIYKYAYTEDNAVRVIFDYAEGMYVKNSDGTKMYDGIVDAFEIAGKDEVYYKAKALLNDDNTITVTAEEVSEPKYIRFQWVNYGEVTLFNKNDIPTAPFRAALI